MSYFDLETAAKLFGENVTGGAGIYESLGMSFGVPQCLLDIGKSAALAVLPSDSILSISDKVQEGRDNASRHIASIKSKYLQENGWFEINTENGSFKFSSDWSRNSQTRGAATESSKFGALARAIGYSAQFGSELYTNYQEADQLIRGIGDCIDSYKTYLELQKGPSKEIAKQLDEDYVDNKYAEEISEVKDALAFIEEVDQILENARAILAARLQDPSLEPEFSNPDIVSGTKFRTISPSAVQKDPIFRLVFGPPKSKKGQFLLSVDGLYYDSQNGGVPDVTGLVLPEDKYKFQHDANLGGKGFAVSLDSVSKFVDTIFDLNVNDESYEMQEQYDSDHFLSVLKNQKLKHIYDLSSQITESNVTSTAMLKNLKQSLFSTAATYDHKINRRKKQIEVAIKAPFIFGKGPLFKKGEVPINDFSYLKDLNLAVAYEKQKKLVLQQAEVSGVVLPIKPKFVKASEAESVVQMNHLIVPSVGTGAIVYDSDGIQQAATVLSLTDLVIKDKLFAIYNFLDGEVTTVGSTSFNVLNCNSTNKYNNARLVGSSASSVFCSGLAIPKFTGIATYNNVQFINGVGSFAILPDTTEFQDWTYGADGFTFETWAYVPNIGRSFTSVEPTTGYGVSSYYRLMLACENSGGLTEEEDVNPNQVGYSNNSTVTRGMIVGFSRDRQITQNISPSASTTANQASAGMFFIAPTRSVNASDVGFVNKASIFGCVSGYEVLKCAVPISTQLQSGKYVSSVGDEFMYFSVAVEPNKNEVRIHIDGELVATSSIPEVFGVPAYSSPDLPSFKQPNSFEYSYSATLSQSHINGPKLNDYFTPWVLGGGYTDGNKPNGGFMNADSGLRSGLNGHLGSTKFYAKALTTSETLANFNGQKGFFKNIQL